ncbi:putative protein kinase RLK-Pelle-CrRLK1L-1 family [Helianthus anomalus]
MAITSEQLCRRYSLSDIQLATKNFDEERVIGHGGFGKVYKGHIDEERGRRTSVAIKRLDSMSNQGAPEFTTEVEMLSKSRHAHLVSLLGCCDDGEEMILVDAGPSVEERAILYLEAQDRITKGASLKWL